MPMRLRSTRRRASRPSPRAKLTRAMGLWGERTRYALPERLPDLPKARPNLPDLERFAMSNRLDIQAAKLQTQGVASSLGLSKATRFVNAVDLGYVNDYETGKGHEHGYEISVEIPLFDWGGAKVARAEAVYMQSANRLAKTAIDARSEVRESYAAYVTSYDVATHYRDEVVPLRKTISDELLLRYNGMLASVFELLADAREQVGAVNGYIDALKDYWLAETDLQMAVGAGCRPTVPRRARRNPPNPKPRHTPTLRRSRHPPRGATGARDTTASGRSLTWCPVDNFSAARAPRCWAPRWSARPAPRRCPKRPRWRKQLRNRRSCRRTAARTRPSRR